MNSSPLSPAGAAGPDPWALAEQAQALKDGEMPYWKKVATNVAVVATAAIVDVAIACIGMTAIAAAFVVSPYLGWPVALVAIALAGYAAARFNHWFLDKYRVGDSDSGADVVALSILQGPMTDQKVAAFLSVQHLCREVSLTSYHMGHSDFDSYDRAIGNYYGNLALAPAAVQLMDDWIDSCDRPLATHDISRTIDMALLGWYACDGRGLNELEREQASAYEQQYRDGVSAGAFSDDADGRHRFALSLLPLPTSAQTISSDQTVQLIKGLGPQCRRFELPLAAQRDAAIVQALHDEGWTVDPLYSSHYRR